LCILFFFFQAEDGIRDWSVTGVQTCALPISSLALQCSVVLQLLAIRDCLCRVAMRETIASGAAVRWRTLPARMWSFVDGWIVFLVLRRGAKFKPRSSPRMENEIRI